MKPSNKGDGMQLQYGKWYLNRSGFVVGPLVPNDWGVDTKAFPFGSPDDGEGSKGEYRGDGTWSLDDDEHRLDLVSEYASPPALKHTIHASDILANVLNEVTRERTKQDTKWGPQDHSLYKWLSILTEEVGEAAQAANDADTSDSVSRAYHNQRYRDELVQVAAVAVAMLESFDRNEGGK